MPVVDGLRNGGVVETGRLAAEDDGLRVDLQAATPMSSDRRASRQRAWSAAEKATSGSSSKCVAQGERPIGRELGQQPVGNRLQAVVVLRFLDVRRHDRLLPSDSRPRRQLQ